MKKLSLIICSLCLTTFLFAQSSKSHSSISTSHSDDAFVMKASFSQNLKPEVEEKLMNILGRENARATKKGWIWTKERRGETAYTFNLEKRRFEASLQQDFLQEKEYEDLIDLCRAVKAIMGNAEAEEEEEEEEKSGLKGDLSLNVNGNPVEMKIEEEVFILEAEYANDLRSKIARKIESEIGAAKDGQAKAVSRWSKEENGKTLYQISVSNTTCNIFIDKTRTKKSEWKALQNLGLSIAGVVLNK